MRIAVRLGLREGHFPAIRSPVSGLYLWAAWGGRPERCLSSGPTWVAEPTRIARDAAQAHARLASFLERCREVLVLVQGNPASRWRDENELLLEEVLSHPPRVVRCDFRLEAHEIPA